MIRLPAGRFSSFDGPRVLESALLPIGGACIAAAPLRILPGDLLDDLLPGDLYSRFSFCSARSSY